MNARIHTEDLAALEREIAADHCRMAIECYAQQAPSNHPTPVYDVHQMESPFADPDILESNRREVQRAVRYLDARELLVRPTPAWPQFVAFREAA